MRPERHAWTSRNAGRKRRVRPEVRAAAQRTFLRILVAIGVAGACGVVGRQILTTTTSTGPEVVWMRHLLGACDYLEGFRECIRVRRFGDGLGELRLRLQPLAQDHVG